MYDFVSSLPANVANQLSKGFQFVKTKTTNDLVATTIDVASPQVTPPNSPLDGQVAKSIGAPVEKFINIVIDTSEYTDEQEVVAYLGDASQVHELTCSSCGGDENTVTPYIGSSACNGYPIFINRLCSTPYTFTGVQLKVYQNGGSDTIVLPEKIEWKRKNINGAGQIGVIDLAIMEDLGAEERSSVRYVTVPLTDEANLFDRDTQWRIPGLVGNKKYVLTLYTGFRGGN